MIKVVLVGSPNVGKSVIFNYLTGQYTAVSNYPGTTIDISRGYSRIGEKVYEFIDTPGMYSLMPLTEEELVARQVLCREKPDIILHVIDAKNIRRMLHLTIQLIDLGVPVILIVNVMDEAKKNGIFLRIGQLSEALGIPVIATTAIRGSGLGQIKEELQRSSIKADPFMHLYSPEIEAVIKTVSAELKEDYGISRRMAALLLIQGDKILYQFAQRKEEYFSEIAAEINILASHYPHGMEYVITMERQRAIDHICSNAILEKGVEHRGISKTLSRLTREPVTGIPILCMVVFFGIYEFVGKFGAGFLVSYIDQNVFVFYINPLVEYCVYQYISWEWLQMLIIGKYGIFTLGFRYAFVIILPVITTFFFMFAILEDSGYLPRLAMLLNSLFKKWGLNGRAVIPFALGVGCGTLAVMATRTLQTRREKILATFLLSLSIPCSAQLGVILALLSESPLSLILWSCYIALIFITVGKMAGKLMPGKSSAFYMELPPLRLPLLSNAMRKAFTRMCWYFAEVVPVFIATSIIMSLADQYGILSAIINGMKPAMVLLGLPIETAQPFLLGFFRRDYGAAGLYEMCTSHSLTQSQLLIACTTLTLFVPCIAQVAVMIKERGILTSCMIVSGVIFLAFIGGVFLSVLLSLFPVAL